MLRSILLLAALAAVSHAPLVIGARVQRSAHLLRDGKVRCSGRPMWRCCRSVRYCAWICRFLPAITINPYVLDTAI